VPVAATDRLAVWLAAIDWLCGWVVIAGAVAAAPAGSLVSDGAAGGAEHDATTATAQISPANALVRATLARSIQLMCHRVAFSVHADAERGAPFL
jgi:hypothetical protein